MRISKMNIGESVSRNFDKVTLELLDEPIEYDSDEMFRAKVKKLFKILREEVEIEFSKIQK